MTAADVWPDGRPKRDLSVWNGVKPLGQPLDGEGGMPSLGDFVACRTEHASDSNGEPLIVGVVLDVIERDGLLDVIVARKIHKPKGHPSARDIRWEYLWETHPLAVFDPARHVPTNVFHRGGAHRAAGEIACAVGARHLNGAAWSRTDRLLLGAALQLADLGHDDREERR